MAEKAVKFENASPEVVAEMEAIMTEHESGLLRYAGRILMDPVAAQDVVQDAFIRLFRLLNSPRANPSKIANWLYRVTHNNAVDYIRRESRLRDLHRKSSEEQTLDDGDAARRNEDEEKCNIVLEHLGVLKMHEKQVLLLRLQEGKSYREIAEITRRSEGNVGCILHHAVQKLSQSLDRAGVI